VPGERFELPTNGLQNRCSATELTRQIPRFSAVCSEIAAQLPPGCINHDLRRSRRRRITSLAEATTHRDLAAAP
jgi:hypothetical protein